MLRPIGALILATYMPFCTPAIRPTMAPDQAQRRMGELWSAPTSLTSSDLMFGPWGEEHAPNPRAVYSFVHAKTAGVSPGLTVADPKGREWSVKQGPEGPVEVVVSRILSAVGYRQPPVYYLTRFTLRDDRGTHVAPGGRFRPKIDDLKEVGEWSFQQNPFVGTKPFEGLLVILMVFDSSDLKNSNNSLYALKHAGADATRWFVVRDLGTALGETGRLDPRRNDPDLFDRNRFITSVHDGFVTFDYQGWHQELFRKRITPDDVKWACDLMAGLTDKQWHDAFTAGGYDPPTADRFIAIVKRRVEQGRALAVRR